MDANTGSADNDYSYPKIVEMLDIPQAFFNEHKGKIIERLGNALLFDWESMNPNRDGDRALAHTQSMNQCLHLASSVTLIGSNKSNLEETIGWLAPIADLIEGSDPARVKIPTLITVAVLAHLFDMVEEGGWLPHEEVLNKLKSIRPEGVPADFRFSNELRSNLAGADWMIGRAAVQKLGLKC